MKVVIFAGGIGSRITEESHLKPKPMIEIGNKPIIWHIMKIFETQGFNEFILCLGYKGNMLKEYFQNYFLNNSDLTINLKNNSITVHKPSKELFKVTLVDTGLHTKTAGRLKCIKPYIGKERFMLTYGDGVADIDIKKIISFHKTKNKIATMTAIQPSGKFGSLKITSDGDVTKFVEKPKGVSGWINGGFFVLEPEVFDYLPENSENCMWEEEPLINLTKANELAAYKHEGFWKCMDAMRDKIELDNLWNSGEAKWKIWK